MRTAVLTLVRIGTGSSWMSGSTVGTGSASAGSGSIMTATGAGTGSGSGAGAGSGATAGVSVAGDGAGAGAPPDQEARMSSTDAPLAAARAAAERCTRSAGVPRAVAAASRRSVTASQDSAHHAYLFQYARSVSGELDSMEGVVDQFVHHGLEGLVI
jgi:hypothetical protein